MKKNIFNIIAVLLFIFMIVYLPLKIVYYDQKIADADKEYEESMPKASVSANNIESIIVKNNLN